MQEIIRDTGSIPWSERSHGEGHGNPLQYSCLETRHGQRSLAGYSPRGHKESDMTEVTQHTCIWLKFKTPGIKVKKSTLFLWKITVYWEDQLEKYCSILWYIWTTEVPEKTWAALAIKAGNIGQKKSQWYLYVALTPTSTDDTVRTPL